MPPSPASRIRAAHEALFDRNDLDAADTFFAPDFVAHGTRGDFAAGPDGVRRFLRALRRGFPDLEVEVEILLAGKDRVAWQRTLRGVQRGAYAGFPATGRRVVWRDLVVSRFRGGRIVEDWSISDLAEQLLRARKR